MPIKQPDLSAVDGQLLDGLEFCRKVYDLFDRVGGGPEGTARLRLRPTKTEKRLLEELVPIARYVQARYREGRRIKVRWSSGSQPFDAILWSSGGLVKHHVAPRKLFVEVTTSVHPNEYLTRRLLHEKGGSFGAKGTCRDKKTGEIISKPHVHSNNELATDLAAQMLERIKSKGEKRYSSGTVLVVNCVTDSLILEAEWDDAIKQVNESQPHIAFREVFLLDLVMSHSATLYGSRKRRHAPTRRRRPTTPPLAARPAG